MRLSFHGAARQVTGSCHLVNCAGRRILIDCGLYQGGRDVEDENAKAFGFDPREIDVLLLTHAHLDHCGRIPLLVKRGFRGEIICTAATRELARLVMLDAAHLQEEEARRKESWSKKRSRKHHSKPGQNEVEEAPLYTIADAERCDEFFGPTADYEKAIAVAPGIVATFYDAGHILGSASILLELEEDGHKRRVLFSGDIGNSGRPVVRDPVVPRNVDVVIMETTYGDRDHRSVEASVEEFYQAVAEALDQGGNVIIPTFALERTQEILYYLRQGVHEKRLPAHLQVFLDSPMAISATDIFRQHPECYDVEAAQLFRRGRDPFSLPGLHFVREATESMALSRITSGALIMAGSGMCTGGRVRHHLKNNLSRSNCGVIFVGFAAEGTLARIIIDGAASVRLFGEQVPVKARIYTINGFSAHAGQRELLAWHAQTGQPRTTFLVHGEESAMQTFAHRLKHTHVEIPSLHQGFDL